jgi:hypothetical protein
VSRTWGGPVRSRDAVTRDPASSASAWRRYDSLYELGADVDQKVDALGAQVAAGFATVSERTDALDAKLDAILERLGGTT